MSRSDEALKNHCLGQPLGKGSWFARCPECEEQLPGGELVCPACGHDFREDPPPETDQGGLHLRDEMAYTPLAELALTVGRALAMVGCFAAIGCACLAIFCGQWLAFVWGPLAFFQSLALYVVTVRVQDAGRGY